MWDPFTDLRGVDVTRTQTAPGTGTAAGGGCIGVSAADFATLSEGDIQANRGRTLLQTNPTSPKAMEVESVTCSAGPGRQEQASDRKAAQLAAENALNPSTFDTA